MKTEFDAKKYKEQRDDLRNMFETQKTGEQTLFRDQSKLFKPVIESQKETLKPLEKLAASQDVLIPFTKELQRRNDQVEALQNLPFYSIKEIESSTPKKDSLHKIQSEALYVDVDKDLLNDTHQENLKLMELDLPSVVQKNGNFEETLRKIEKENRSLGQLTGEKSKHKVAEKLMYQSRKETLKIYKGAISRLQGAQQFLVKSGTGLPKKPVCRPKRGKGRPKKLAKDVIFYGSPDDLVAKLNEYLAAKSAGNTGLDDSIISILDELLRIRVITKDEYDAVYSQT
jgi:hypothetical protein